MDVSLVEFMRPVLIERNYFPLFVDSTEVLYWPHSVSDLKIEVLTTTE